MKRLKRLVPVVIAAGCMAVAAPASAADPIHHPPSGKVKCNSGGGNGSELVNGVDCDPGNSGGKNNGGD